MGFYIGITVLTIALAYMVTNQYSNQCGNGVLRTAKLDMRSRYALVAIFVVLFLVASLRYFVGIDYYHYLAIYQKIWAHEKVSTEIGFNALVVLCQFFFGKDTFVPIFAILGAATIYYMLRALYDQMEWFFYGFILFMLSGYYLTSLNTIRYYLAFAIAMYAIKYVLKGDYLPFFIYVGIAATFHKTILIVIPVYWFAARKWSKLEVILLGLGSASLLLFEEFYRMLIFKVYPYYENSVYDTNATSYFNIAKCICVLVFALICYKTVCHEERLRFYFHLNIIGLIVYSCCSFVPVVSRMGYYFVWVQVFLLGNLVTRMKRGKWKNLCMISILLAHICFFLFFLSNAAGADTKIIPYQTWIGAQLYEF